jgi:hypothetical protein
VDGFDDLGVIDLLQGDRRDAEVAVAKLTLDDDERHALVGHLNSVRMAKLMRSEHPAHSSGGRGAPKLRAGGGR